MKVKRIELIRFKRFTHFLIDEIPESVRLVILAGPNGTGKSSLFDGLYSWYRATWSRLGLNWVKNYYVKQLMLESGGVAMGRNIQESVNVVFYDPQPREPEEQQAAVYVRSAYRNDPSFQVSELRRMESVLTDNLFMRFIDNDATVSRNYQRMTSQGFRAIYKDESPDTTVGQFRKKTVGELQLSIERLFPDLKLNDLGDPLEDGTFYFDKGNSKTFAYRNLSGGEKAAFDLILDLIVKRNTFVN
jgi:hypothetical protein